MFLFIEADGRSDVKPVMKYLVLQHKPVLKVASAKLLTQSSVGWYLNSIHTIYSTLILYVCITLWINKHIHRIIVQCTTFQNVYSIE